MEQFLSNSNFEIQLMSKAKTKTGLRITDPDSTRAVDEFMRDLDHPFKNLIETIRVSILRADKTIDEGIKWNSPSFRTREYFATMNLREKKGIGVILHLGAKVRDLPAEGIKINDPAKLLKWLGRDRAMIVFESLADFDAKNAAFELIIQRWITNVGGLHSTSRR
jgi:hypothetical protein